MGRNHKSKKNRKKAQSQRNNKKGVAVEQQLQVSSTQNVWNEEERDIGDEKKQDDPDDAAMEIVTLNKEKDATEVNHYHQDENKLERDHEDIVGQEVDDNKIRKRPS